MENDDSGPLAFRFRQRPHCTDAAAVANHPRHKSRWSHERHSTPTRKQNRSCPGKLIHPARDSSSNREPVAPSRACLHICAMDLKDGASIVADLTTIGRKTGLARTVELRFIYHQGSFYASSSRVNGKHWCENLLENPAVVITVKGQKVAGRARQVNDDKLRRKILAARHSLSDLDRIVFEITPRD